jgi:hypothetical protein
VISTSFKNIEILKEERMFDGKINLGSVNVPGFTEESAFSKICPNLTFKQVNYPLILLESFQIMSMRMSTGIMI